MWTNEGTQSLAALSDTTDHRMEAVIASVKPVILSLTDKGKTLISIITDFPLNQYRNKKSFYLIQELAVLLKIIIRWIYLESGHGKGIPDGIGAVVKRGIVDLIASHPDQPVYNVSDLVQLELADLLPSVQLYEYSQEDIVQIFDTIPDLIPISGTLKLHEIQTHVNKDGDNYFLIKDTSDQDPWCVKLTVKKGNTKVMQLKSNICPQANN